ncbi:MAG: cytochrome c, class I [Cycloclasticus sp.]|nr:MAG: cytochrome c, class I [Cycloclasticus sp.]
MSEDKKVFSDLTLVIGVLVLVAVIISIIAVNLVDTENPNGNAWKEKKLLDRIKPLGEVATTAEEALAASPKSDEPQPVESTGPMTAEQIYDTACMACHTTGAASAPVLGDVAAWAPRIAQGADVLFEHATKGFKGMPPRGGSPQLSDDEIKASIEYMVEKSS